MNFKNRDSTKSKTKLFRVRLSEFRRLGSYRSNKIKMENSENSENKEDQIDQYVEDVLGKYDDKIANIILLNESLVKRNNDLSQQLADLESQKKHLRNNTSEELKVNNYNRKF